MSNQSANDHLLVRYLLGQVSEEDRASIEERFIRDQDYFNQLLIVEDELRCAYARGSLLPDDRRRFEERFLIFPDERNRVGLAKAMIGELSSMSLETAREPVAARRAEKKGWRALFDSFGLAAPALRFAAMAAVMLVVITCAWLTFEAVRLRKQISQLTADRDNREREIAQQSAEERERTAKLTGELEDERSSRALLEQELAQQREQALRKEQLQPTIVSLLLSPGLIRGGGETKKLEVQQGTADARLLLNLEEKGGYRSYQAIILDSEARQVWSRSGLRATQARGARFVVLRIPTRLLAEDDYQINVRGITESGEAERVGDYYFRVLKEAKK